MRITSRHAVLSILTLVIVIHAIDRLAIVILLEDIKVDLALSDAQLGFLSGFAFVALYAAASIPMAFVSDRSNRSRLIGVALMAVGWMTVLCGFAQTFVQLVAARCGVGISASPCVPAAHSIVADLYPRQQRTTALSITEAGFFVGAFLGLWMCGWIATHYGWRTALYTVGVLPILLSLCVLAAIRDPPRARKVQEARMGLRGSLGTIVGVAAVRWYVLGSGLAVLASASMMTWLPSLMIRSYGMTRTEAGGLIGAISGIGGLTLTILIGILADVLARRDRRWNLWLSAILFAVSAPLAAATFLSHSPAVMLSCFALSTSLVTACSAPIISYSQQIMPSRVHAMITALIFFVLNVVGFGIGPLIVGALSDLLMQSIGSQAALQQALLYLTVPSLLLAACFVTTGAWRSANGKVVEPAVMAC